MSKKEQKEKPVEQKQQEQESATPPQQEKKPIFEFSPDEFDLLSQQNSELKIDDENNTDLLQTPDNKPDLSEKELDKIAKDPKYNTTITEHGEVPSLLNTLGPTDSLGKITDVEVNDINTRNDKDRKNLIILLAAKDYINLDIHIGDKDGKAMYIQKQYYFKSISKKEELQLKLKQARLTQLSHRYTILVNKEGRGWTDEEAEFITMAQAMMEIASYQFMEHEAKLKLGMPHDDFARVETQQYGLALSVINRRNQYPSFSNRGQ